MKFCFSNVSGIFESCVPYTIILNILGCNISCIHTWQFCCVNIPSETSRHMALRSWCFKLTLWHWYSSDAATEMCILKYPFNKWKIWQVKLLLEWGELFEFLLLFLNWVDACQIWIAVGGYRLLSCIGICAVVYMYNTKIIHKKPVSDL